MSSRLHALVSTAHKTPLYSLFGKKILVVTGHPDDESYVAAGTLALLVKCKSHVELFCATNGEKGASHLKRKVTLQQLSRIRAKELQRASRILGIRKVRFGNFPDGSLHVTKYTKELQQKIEKHIAAFRPDTIISFGSDGISGHKDHIAVGKIAKQMAKKYHLCFIAFALPPKAAQRAHEWLISRRRNPHYIPAKKIWYAIPTIRVKIDSTIKKKALFAHQSQMDGKKAFTGFPRFVAWELTKAEYFVL